MAVDLDILEKYGLTVDLLRSKFTTATEDRDPEDKTRAVINLIHSRIDEGIRKSLREARHWWALDQAFDTPFYAISPTLTKWLLSGKFDTEGVQRISKEWGLSHLIREERDLNGGVVKTIDIPAFFEIAVPVAKAYCIIRSAVIFNERNVYPFFKFDPAQLTAKNKMRCDIITDRVQKMASQYGYPAISRQSILSKNIYGTSLMFPAECWHRETQIHKDDKEVTVREGLRYNLPHMSRVFWDLNYRLSTFNTDTGCTYGGYWQVNRYGDVKDNPDYWNLDKLTYGTDWMTSNPTFFTTLYPCVCKFPTDRTNRLTNNPTAGGNAQTPVTGAGAMDREAAAGYYAADEEDKAITFTQLFMKMIPKKYGWGTYPHPVWFRFVVANESTVIYAEPLAYSPVVYRGYDAHEEREINSSIVLECLPFQDHIGNLLSQQLLTIKQNLLSAVFFNEDAVGKGAADRIKNLGKKWYMEINFIPYSSRMAQFAGKDIKEAFFPVNFPRLDTTAILAGIRSLLDMMERILVMSSQEIGAAASHEQTAEETRVIATSTSNRLKFTASYDDDADLAWKKQLYDALMAYGDEDVYAQVETTEGGNTEKVLTDLGFTVDEDRGGKGDPNTGTKTAVKGNKTALGYEEFASTRSATDRINNMALANAMVQLLSVVFNNPLIFAAIGPAQAVKLVNQVAAISGFYNEFKLEAIPGAAKEEQDKQAQEQVGGMLAQLKEVLEKEMNQTIGAAVSPIAQAIQTLTQQFQQIAQAVPQLGQAIGQINQKVDQNTQQTAQVIQQIGAKDGEQDQAIAKLTQLFGVVAQAAGLPPPEAIQGSAGPGGPPPPEAGGPLPPPPPPDAGASGPPGLPPPNPGRFRVIRT